MSLLGERVFFLLLFIIVAMPNEGERVKNLKQIDMCYYSTLPEILYDTVVERNSFCLNLPMKLTYSHFHNQI